jgi:hypothetical protein
MLRKYSFLLHFCRKLFFDSLQRIKGIFLDIGQYIMIFFCIYHGTSCQITAPTDNNCGNEIVQDSMRDLMNETDLISIALKISTPIKTKLNTYLGKHLISNIKFSNELSFVILISFSPLI